MGHHTEAPIRKFLIVPGGVLLSGVVMAMVTPMAPGAARWAAVPVLVAGIAVVWWYADRVRHRSPES
jgi:hypothetical protein